MLLTNDDLLPVIEIDENYPNNFSYCHPWLMKVNLLNKIIAKLKVVGTQKPFSSEVLFVCNFAQSSLLLCMATPRFVDFFEFSNFATNFVLVIRQFHYSTVLLELHVLSEHVL